MLRVVENCNIICQSMQDKSPHNNYKSWLQGTFLLQRIHIDFADCLCVKLFVCTDSFSKFIQAWIIKSTNTEETCERLQQFMNLFGIPTTIVTKNGTLFKGEVFYCFCIQRGITLLHSLPYHPPSNGPAERAYKLSR